MTDLKLQNIDHVKILAKETAQRTREDQVVYRSYEGRYRIFRFCPLKNFNGQPSAIVRYTKKDIGGNILRGDENGGFATSGKKSTGSGKPKRGKSTGIKPKA